MTTRRITLTFDNGPDPLVTPGVLDCLEKHRILTTFFLIGSRAAAPEGMALARRALAAGHWLGNHTYSHRTPLGLLPPREAVQEFDETERAVAAIGETRRLFRPYGGAGKLGKHLLRREVVDLMTARGYTCVIWNSVPGDWHDPEGWKSRALQEAASREWSLMVLHDVNADAMKHLDAFLTQLAEESYEFRQDFPPECTPIIDGRLVLPMDELVT